MGGPLYDRTSTTGSFSSAASLNLLRCVYAFEEIGEDLPYIPLAARRVLDALGRRLSLDGWLSLHLADRKVLLLAGAADLIDADVVDAVLSRAHPAPTMATPMAPIPETAPPPEVVHALGPDRPLDAVKWHDLHALDRYILLKVADKPEKLARAYDEIVGQRVQLAHVDAQGQARMVDVGAKGRTARRAIASARVTMSQAVLDKLTSGDTVKGDVFAVARVAGIQAAKKTPELIPLCHTVALTRIEVKFSVDRPARAVVVQASAEAYDRTGVEMEAMVAASVASLTIYDMLKSGDRWMTIGDVRLEEKSGGQSGDVKRPTEPPSR